MAKRFAKKVKVVTKQGGTFGIIVESLGSYRWKVEVVDPENGRPTGEYFEASSQMMRHPAEDEYPIERTDDGAPVETTTNQNARASVTEEAAPERNLDPNNNEGEGIEVTLRNETNPSDADTNNVETAPDLQAVSDDSEDESVDPDDILEEDVPFDPVVPEDEQAAFNAADFIEARGIEVEPDKHKAKWDLYVDEKNSLLQEGYSVTKKATKKSSIGIGEKVQELRGQKRTGVIIHNDRKPDDAGPMWTIRFEDGTQEQRVASTKLKLAKDNRQFVWKIVKDSEPTHPLEKARRVGVCGFNFETAFDEAETKVGTATYQFPYLSLLIHLWPGNWKDHLRNLNAAINKANATLNVRHAKRKQVSLVSEQEWWTVWGIIFVASPCHKGGIKLFQSTQTPGCLAPAIDMSIDKTKYDGVTGAIGRKKMSWNRFKTIKEFLHSAFDDGTNDADPWHPIVQLVEGFNDNRKKWIVGELIRVLDESMSAFQPRTTKLSLLPFLSFIFRKPKPLGTEYKVVADVLTGIITYIEIQRGAVPMRLLPFHSSVGGTSACTLRLSIGGSHTGVFSRERKEMESNEKRHLIIGDSWFGSVKAAEAIKLLARRKTDAPKGPYQDMNTFKDIIIDPTVAERTKGYEFIGAVKTNSGWYPKKELEKIMKNWPSGSHIVLECTTPNTNVELVAIGYKYNAKKVLCFVMTKDAGSTYPGAPYKAKFPDQCGNTCERSVTRPQALSEFFRASNLIDSHNHARQSILGLEKYWHTTNPWFRNITTIVGMTVIDCWKALKFRLGPQYGKMTVEEFADHLAYDCYHNGYNRTAMGTTAEDIPADAIADTESELSSRQGVGGSMPSTIFAATAQVQQQLHNMTISCCGGAPNASPMTMASIGQAFNFGMSNQSLMDPMDPHESMAQRVKETNSQGKQQGVKRHCVICGKETRNECRNRTCKGTQRWYGGAVYHGTPVCSNQAKTRTDIPRLNLKNNTKSCLQIHREQVLAQQQAQHQT